MTATRTFARSAAVLGAATALTVAGAGAAMAKTVPYHEVEGNDVTVTFNWTSDGFLDRLDSCGAVITPTGAAASIAAKFAQATSEGSLLGVLNALRQDDAVRVLTQNGERLGLPVVALGDLNKSDTLSAKDLPSNVYALVSVCTDEPTKPVINPVVLVGGPVEAVMGSVDSLSAGGAGLDTLSSVLDSDDASGLGGVLSSAVGGGEGDLLGTLSAAAGDDE